MKTGEKGSGFSFHTYRYTDLGVNKGCPLISCEETLYLSPSILRVPTNFQRFNNHPVIPMSAFQELYERSQKEKRGVTFHVNGQTIAGVVLQINEDTVVAYNQTFDRIVLRRDRIDAAAMQ